MICALSGYNWSTRYLISTTTLATNCHYMYLIKDLYKFTTIKGFRPPKKNAKYSQYPDFNLIVYVG